MSDISYFHIGAFVYRLAADGQMQRSSSVRPVTRDGVLRACATFGTEEVDFPSSQFKILSVDQDQAVQDLEYATNGRGQADEATVDLTDAQLAKLREAAALGDGNVKGTTFNGLRQLKLVDGTSLTVLGKSVLAQKSS